MLTWTYYASLIVLMGAELTRGLADARCKPIRPSAHAVEIAAASAELTATDLARAGAGQVASAGIALLVSGVLAGAAMMHARAKQPPIKRLDR